MGAIVSVKVTVFAAGITAAAAIKSPIPRMIIWPSLIFYCHYYTKSGGPRFRSGSASTLRRQHRTMAPENVVPAQELLCAIEQLGIAAPAGFEGKLLHSIRRVGRGVAQDVEHLLLPRDLIEGRILPGIEPDIGRIGFVGHAPLITDLHPDTLARSRGEVPVLRIDDRPGAARGGALHLVGRSRKVDAEGSGRIGRVFAQPPDHELRVHSARILHRHG